MPLLLLWLACSDAPDDSGDSALTTPELRSDPAEINFGLVPYDGHTEVEAELEIANVGGGTLLMLDLAIDGGQESPFALASVPSTNLLRGERVHLGLTAVARGPGEASDALRILTNDPLTPELVVPLRMLADGPGVRVTPEALAFGELALGCDASERVVIENSGSATLTVNAAQINGGLAFSLDLLPAENGSLPWSLEPGEQREVEVSFTPGVPGADSAELRVNSDDPLRDALELPLSGSAAAAEALQQSTQLAAEVDVLFVVDLGAASAPYRAQLIDDLGDLTEALARDDADYRLSATVGDDGCVLGGALYVGETAGTTAQQAALELMLDGVAGDLTAHGLARTEAALSASCNDGLLREGAAVAVILLSAADDADVGAVSDAVAAIEAALPYPSQLRLNALAGEVPDGCEVAAAGVRYERAAELTGGTFDSICDNSYRAAFSAMAEEATATAVSFLPLEQPAVENSIRLSVRGVERPDGWTYDPEERAIRLEDSLRVGAGDTVSVSYSPMPESCD